MNKYLALGIIGLGSMMLFNLSILNVIGIVLIVAGISYFSKR